MIIKSYLLFPIEGRFSELQAEVDKIPACEVTPSTNRNVLILVTETENEAAENSLEAQLQALPSLQTITLVSGHNDD